MKTIVTETEFTKVLYGSTAVVYIDQVWSAYTRMVDPIIRQWLEQSPVLQTYRIDKYIYEPDQANYSYTFDWLADQDIDPKYKRIARDHGYGDMLWIKAGKIVNAIAVWETMNSFDSSQKEPGHHYTPPQTPQQRAHRRQMIFATLDEISFQLTTG